MAEGNFNYDGPQFLDMENIDIKNEDVEEIESYFEFDHEQDESSIFVTPTPCVAMGRLSKSMSSLAVHDPETLVEVRDDEVISERAASTIKQGRSRQVSRLVELSKPKVASNKFTSINEGTRKFQVATPLRFRTQPLRANRMVPHGNAPIPSTIAHSPALATKYRSRPANILSAAEREEKIMQEMQKFKVKANPVNRKVLEPLKPIHLNSKPTTATQTPTVLKRFPGRVRAQSSDRVTVPNSQSRTSTRTQVEPFSFERRDMNKRQMKDVLMRQQLDDERKAREFKAHPMPKAVYAGPAIPVKQLTRGMGSLDSLRVNKNDEMTKFTARPPASLLVSPFVPKRSTKPTTQIESFSLTSNQRVHERRTFDERIKEKQQKLKEEALLKEIEQNNQLFQAERKLTIQKARPIKKYKPIALVASKTPTVPVTPAVLRSRVHNKEN